MTHIPVGIGSSIVISTGVATTSTAFSVQSTVLRVVAVGGAAHVAIGTEPSATTTDYYVSSSTRPTIHCCLS